MSDDRHMIPVWFFVGILLFVYGILILVSGLQEWSHPPATVLASLHAPVWWGALMIVMGGLFIHLFRPRKKSP
jgi:divalent metal cation (Fe/Co/Zn/Cd) transporter